MMDFSISREELFRWCSIPWQELEKQPELKTKLVVKETRAQTMEIIGNMMAEEVIKNNADGKPTKWVLPAGPTDEYDIFIARVNQERIWPRLDDLDYTDRLCDELGGIGCKGLVAFCEPPRSYTSRMKWQREQG